MGWFCGDDFTPTEKNQRWARVTFCIDHDEVERQTELFIDREYKTKYTDWQKVWRNSMRKAEEFGQLKRPHIPRTPEEISEEQKEEDRRKGWENMDRLKAVK